MLNGGQMVSTAFNHAASLLAVLFVSGCCHLPSQSAQPALVLSSVAVSVPDLDDAVAWYRDNLGFDVEKRSSFPDYHLRLAWLVREQARLEIVELQASQPASSVLPGLDNPALLQGFGKIAFRVRNAAQLAEDLKRKGVRFQIDLRDDPGTQSRTFIILDNNGNWLQFSEPIPSPSRPAA